MININSAFPNPLDVRYVDERQFKLLEPFAYINSPVKIVVPAGFITDGASIPKAVWSIVGSPWTGKYVYATIPHDWGYTTQTMTRREVDDIFNEGMRILGVSWWKRKLMYRCVRMFAWVCWNKKKRRIT